MANKSDLLDEIHQLRDSFVPGTHSQSPGRKTAWRSQRRLRSSKSINCFHLMFSVLGLTLLSFSKARVICDPWFVSSEKKRKDSVDNAIKQKLCKELLRSHIYRRTLNYSTKPLSSKYNVIYCVRASKLECSIYSAKWHKTSETCPKRVMELIHWESPVSRPVLVPLTRKILPRTKRLQGLLILKSLASIFRVRRL